MGIVYWEIINRTIKGVYESPYAEFNYKFDWQILMAVTTQNTRPTVAASVPTELAELLKEVGDPEPNIRPDAKSKQTAVIQI